MAKKDYFLIVDTETTIDGKVADFGAVVTDKKGNIMTQCAVMVYGIFTDMENHKLFYIDDPENHLWSKQSLERRYNQYNAMVKDGSRMISSVNAINRWLEKVNILYSPYTTAYNLPFDLDKCNNTDIDLSIFSKRFCLWAASYSKWGHTKKFREFVLENHYFNNPTKHGNMSFKTNAEVMARFVTGIMLDDEPHTALEDVLFYELPILLRLVNTTKKEKWLYPRSYNWRECQVKDNFTV